MEDYNQENVWLKIPVKVRYRIIQDFLRKKFIGEVIRKEDEGKDSTDYAEIISLSLVRSAEENYDVLLYLQVRTLTSFFKNKIIRLKMYLSLSFDEAEQEISVEDYSLEGENNSWLMNKFLQVLANTFMYSNFRKKMRFNFKDLLKEQQTDLNIKLKDSLEVFTGTFLEGKLNQVKVTEVIPGKDYLLVSLSLSARAVVDIQNLSLG